MRAWRTRGDGHEQLRLEEVPTPLPRGDEVLVRVRACGVCRTDLHVTDGDLPLRRTPLVPGHEAVGDVVAVGPGATGRALGDRVGVAWLGRTCGSCRWCRRGAENLCRGSRYTGWDEDGGYAEYVAVAAPYTYLLPPATDPVQTAPLLCAGIIGYRALRRAHVPPGGRLGLYGFGASAHLTAQVALAQGVEVHVLTRDPDAQRLALDLGATSAGGAADQPPVPLDAAILFAPAGELVPVALAALDQGGTLALAGIHLSDVPPLDHQRHLFRERTLTSVTSNTRADGEELLTLAPRLGVRATVTRYPFERASQALTDLAHDRVSGAAVLVP
ncbi:zinc-binding alcohol dehydrogenase family protein [Nocardioides euryhalodurans]|uniref:Probable alcohol dehydrogenase AdhA n=2 Tax=Nocardioides euryhalodurans TaxID=2518370 RepID=A0A4P7GPV6_9ACTN|nr:zinc-binding alcohol dehydrogenase family protein [Nocardioides euryhalodurans]